MTPNQCKQFAPFGRRTALSGWFWPYLPVKEVLNVAEADFRNTLETGRSREFPGNSECYLS